MFETITQSATQRWSKGAVYAMPVTLLIYALIGSGLALFSLFGPQNLRPPIPTALIFTSVIPIDIPLAGDEKAEEEGEAEQEPEPAPDADDGTLVEPDKWDAEIPPPSREPVGKRIGRIGFEGGLPPELSTPHDPNQLVTKSPPVRPIVHKPGDIRGVTAISKIYPKLPPHLEAMRLKAEVVVETVIDENGVVESVRIARSNNALFDVISLDAAKKWRFTRPVSLGGEPVRVYHYITFRYR